MCLMGDVRGAFYRYDGSKISLGSLASARVWGIFTALDGSRRRVFGNSRGCVGMAQPSRIRDEAIAVGSLGKRCDRNFGCGTSDRVRESFDF